MLKIILLLLILMNIDLSAKEWVEKQNFEHESYRTLQCIDSANCYAFADNGHDGINRIYKSIDQGATWHIIYHYDNNNEPDILAMNRCFVSDTLNIILSYKDVHYIDKSTDGGKTFNRVFFESANIEITGPIWEIVMYNKNIGIIEVGNELVFTRDGWKSHKIFDLLGEYKFAGRPMFFIDSSNVALSKRSILSNDFYKFDLETESLSSYTEAGEIAPGEEEKCMYKVCFVNDSVGFACGGQSYGAGVNEIDIIWKTTDRGENWDIIHENKYKKTPPALEISFSDELHGMAVGGFDKIMETTDGGENWFYHTDLPEDLVKTMLVRVALAGEYNIVSSMSGGIYRYEEPVSVQESEFKDVKFDFNQTPENLTINISDENHRKYRLQIVDIQGKSMYEGSLLYSLENVVGLSGYAAGGYVYRVLCENVLVRSGKFVVTR
ncbi:MAG: hypothetical protein KAH48_09000 [Chlorobi bacterium]|nr:hypothetical protein [Chlorobiota bacterium]